MTNTDLWLPEGLHWDLHIEHKQIADAGPFTGGGHKLLLHTTESPREAVDSMWDVVRTKNASPHFVIGWRKGTRLPVVIQCIPLNRAARALAHPFGPETNRANVIQIEICGRAAESPDWDENWYKALANLATLIRHRFDFDLVVPHKFTGTRFDGVRFVQAKGIVGHCHVPGNDHTDPGKLRADLLLKYLKAGKQQVKPR